MTPEEIEKRRAYHRARYAASSEAVRIRMREYRKRQKLHISDEQQEWAQQNITLVFECILRWFHAQRERKRLDRARYRERHGIGRTTKWARNNPGKHLEHVKRWKLKNPEKVRESNLRGWLKWIEKNPEKYRQMRSVYTKKYRAKNREKRRLIDLERRAENPEALRNYVRRYKAKNREKLREWQRQYRIRNGVMPRRTGVDAAKKKARDNKRRVETRAKLAQYDAAENFVSVINNLKKLAGKTA